MAHTPPEKSAHEPSVESCGCHSGASCASGCPDDGCPTYCFPACEKKIGPNHKEPNRLPLPGKTKPDDYGVTMRRTVNQKHYGTMLKPLLGLQIQSYNFDILHCKLRVIPQIFKWIVTQNVDAEKLDKVCDKCFSVFTIFFSMKFTRLMLLKFFLLIHVSRSNAMMCCRSSSRLRST
jgi:hypothetical protein